MKNQTSVRSALPFLHDPVQTGLPLCSGGVFFMEEKICGIYKITNPSKKIYIGQSFDINKRFRQYRNCNCEHQNKLFSSLKKYGSEAHVFEILHQCNFSKLDELEKYYIELFQSTNTKTGLNLKTGGGHGFHSEETKQKIGNANRGRKLPLCTDEYRKKMSEIKKGNTVMVGRHHTAETKIKMGLIHKGNKYNLGRIPTLETKIKMSESAKRVVHTEEWNRKVSIARKLWWKNKKTNLLE